MNSQPRDAARESSGAPPASIDTSGFVSEPRFRMPIRPDTSPPDEVEAACFETRSEADRIVGDLMAAGVEPARISILSDRNAKWKFMKPYLHFDADRHTQSHAGAVGFASAGAMVGALITMASAIPFAAGPAAIYWLSAGGGVVGALCGAALGAIAFRASDDKSIEIAERLCGGGFLVVIRRPTDDQHVPLDSIGRILSRHGGRSLRIHYQVEQADLHPGDTRREIF
jgi:hypothetical protein